MKLRNRTKTVPKIKRNVVREVGEKISQVLPATEAITAGNAASPILQLPQEVKNMIYKHVLPGQHIIHVEDRRWTKRRFQFGPCYENSTEKEAEQEVQTASENRNPFPPSILDRHARCWQDLDNGSYLRFNSLRLTFSLDIALLFCCRQIYHEAKYTLYGTNTFSFRSPRTLRAFMCSTGHGPAANYLTIRNVHLRIRIGLREHEYTWNKALSLMVKKLPGVKNVCVTIDQQFRCGRPWNHPSGFQRVFTNPATGSNFFLRGILELRKLPLSGLVLTVAESGYPINAGDITWMAAEDIATRWTQAQKVEWARFVKVAILKSG